MTSPAAVPLPFPADAGASAPAPQVAAPFPAHAPLPQVRAPSLTETRQLPVPRDDKEDVYSSVYFRVWCPEGSANFSEMSGVNSEMEQTEYMESGPLGAMYSRHGGRAKPPTIQLKRALKRGLDSTWLWTWHQAARRSLPGGRRDVVLMLYGSGDDPGMPARVNYTLINAFPTKIEVSPTKLGGTEVVSQTMVLQCDEILDTNMI